MVEASKVSQIRWETRERPAKVWQVIWRTTNNWQYRLQVFLSEEQQWAGDFRWWSTEPRRKAESKLELRYWKLRLGH